MTLPSDGLLSDEKEGLNRLREHFCEPASRVDDVSSRHSEGRKVPNKVTQTMVGMWRDSEAIRESSPWSDPVMPFVLYVGRLVLDLEDLVDMPFRLE